RRGVLAGAAVHHARGSDGGGRRARVEPARPRRRRGPRARGERGAQPGVRAHRRGTAVRRGHGGGRADRLSRAGRPAHRAAVHRARPPLAHPRRRADGRGAAAVRRHARPGGDQGRGDPGRGDAGRARRALLHRAGAQAQGGEPVSGSTARAAAPGAEQARAVRPALRAGPVSLVLRPRVAALVVVLAALAFLMFCLDIAFGETTIPLGRVLDVLGGGGTRSQRYIVLDSRLPRALTALVVGAALGLAGAITQSILHNPLASPDILGVTTGASLGAIAVLVFAGVGSTGLAATVGAPLAALACGLITAVLIYVLAWGRTAGGGQGATGLRFVLIGIGMNALLAACVSWLV